MVISGTGSSLSQEAGIKDPAIRNGMKAARAIFFISCFCPVYCKSTQKYGFFKAISFLTFIVPLSIGKHGSSFLKQQTIINHADARKDDQKNGLKMKRQFIYIIALIVFITGCGETPKPIREDLDTRYLKYDIVKVKKDSSVYDSVMMLLNHIENAVTEMEHIKFEYSQLEFNLPLSDNKTIYIVKNRELALYDSLVAVIDTLHSKIKSAENARYEPCYYIKYTVLNGQVKDEYEEYWFLINNKLKHRPVNFEEFLGQTNYQNLNDRLQELYRYIGGFRNDYLLRLK